MNVSYFSFFSFSKVKFQRRTADANEKYLMNIVQTNRKHEQSVCQTQARVRRSVNNMN